MTNEEQETEQEYMKKRAGKENQSSDDSFCRSATVRSEFDGRKASENNTQACPPPLFQNCVTRISRK